MAQRPRILIVDDEPDIVGYLEHVLHSLGYDTVAAANGAEGLDRAAAESPDLVLTDVVMPVMDGITLCRTLKASDDTRLTPVVIMTALGGLEDRIRGIQAGADDFLTKPVDQRELTARIETALRLKQTADRKLFELGRIRDHFAKFVPEAVRRLVAANPEAPELSKREADVSVLFLDISGYVRLSERLPPETLNALVERYFSRFLDRIQAAGGDINETAGDGFMAIFQDPDPRGHAAKAVDTALGLLDVADALNREEALHPLSIHMGVSSGTAWVGSTRLEGRTGARWTFTASGAVTNLASRLAGAARAGEILVGPETAHRLGARYRLERAERERLKNIAEPIEPHRVVRESPAGNGGGHG